MNTPRPPLAGAEPWVLSVAMLAAIALVLGGARAVRAGRDRRQGVLMLVAAAVIVGNVLIWAWP